MKLEHLLIERDQLERHMMSFDGFYITKSNMQRQEELENMIQEVIK